MKIIDGNKIAEDIRRELAKEVAMMIDNNQKAPHLVAILVGNDPASETYVNSKHKDCQSVGFTSSIYRFEEKISEKELLENIDFLNNDDEVDGFIVQLPLPSHISTDKVIQRIKPEKDVDGFHPINVGKMAQGLPTYLSATPYGIMELIKRYGIETKGKHCVVVGRSNIVGTPMSILMSRNNDNANSTVTICHSRTENLKEITKQADILIVAIGKPHFITADMVKEGSVVIDVGMHRVESDKTKSGYKLIGDVDFDNVSKKVEFITPVPGGVGPMTRVSLLRNTLLASKKELYK